MIINVSPTGIENFDSCPELWHLTQQGAEMTGSQFEVGRTAHKAATEISKAASRSEDGIALEDVEPIIERYSNRFPNFKAFAQISDGLRRHAERVNERRMQIAGLERKFEIIEKVGTITIRIRGRVDEFGYTEKREWAVIELKTFGMIPTPDELRGNPQTSLYAALVRDWAKYNGIVWKGWYSIVHGAMVWAPADLDDARAAKQYVRGRAQRMAKCIRDGRFPRVVCRNCPHCPDVKRCKAWRAERKQLGIPEIVPTLDNYIQARDRGQAWQTVKNRMKDPLMARVEAAGGILTENGYRAELKFRRGGLKDEYKDMTKAQLLAVLTTNPRTTLLVKATR